MEMDMKKTRVVEYVVSHESRRKSCSVCHRVVGSGEEDVTELFELGSFQLADPTATVYDGRLVQESVDFCTACLPGTVEVDWATPKPKPGRPTQQWMEAVEREFSLPSANGRRFLNGRILKPRRQMAK
jgi:hypothetical protein